MLKLKSLITVFIPILVFTGCTHKDVKATNDYDSRLQCEQILSEINQINLIKSEVDSNTGISLRNTALILFWPLILVNEFNGAGAKEKIEDRLDVLNLLAKNKNCPFSKNEDIEKDYKEPTYIKKL